MRAPKHVISLEKNHRELATTEYGHLIVHNNIIPSCCNWRQLVFHATWIQCCIFASSVRIYLQQSSL